MLFCKYLIIRETLWNNDYGLNSINTEKKDIEKIENRQHYTISLSINIIRLFRLLKKKHALFYFCLFTYLLLVKINQNSIHYYTFTRFSIIRFEAFAVECLYILL